MQGIVTDDKGAFVKAAIVKLSKIRDSNEESETEAVTYAETDEEGRFIFQELNSDEKYFIEIYVKHSESRDEKDDADIIEGSEPDAMIEEPEKIIEPEKTIEVLKIEEPESDYGIIDSLKTNNMIDDIIRGSISICNLNYMTDLDLKEKSYLTKSNLW